MEVVAAQPAACSATCTEADFERLYREHSQKVFSTAYRITGNRPDAEDVTQEVFIRVFKKLHTFRGESAISTWIYRITVNRALDILRRRKHERTVPLDESLESISEPMGVMKLIEGTLPSMPDGYRQVFVLHDIQGLRHCEIAKILGISEGASKSQLHRARAFLRSRIGEQLRQLSR
ncbi:MAG: RNA polymerase sigma factor [candidate division WOR-3 bacterium]